MDRCVDIPHHNEYARDSGFANIKSTTSHRLPLFHSKNRHVELRIDLIPLISPPVYRGARALRRSASHSELFFDPADDKQRARVVVPIYALKCAGNGTGVE